MDHEQVLVTGGGGFIGSHLVEHLLEQGRTVRALVPYTIDGGVAWLERLREHPRLAILRGDVRDGGFVRRAASECSAVLHLAAQISIPYSYEAPRTFIETNTIGTLNVLEAARECKLRKVILTSTSEVYGSAQRAPMDEAHPLSAQSPYAASKVAADQLGLSFYRSFGTPVAILRPFNNFGPRQTRRAVIPSIMHQMLFGEGEIRVGNVQTARDFLFVLDTVEAFTLALDQDASIGQVINLATGIATKIEEVIVLLEHMLGRNFRRITEAFRLRPEQSEVTLLCGDNRKAQQLLGWKPRFLGPQGFEDALRRTLEFIRSSSESAEGVSRYVT